MFGIGFTEILVVLVIALIVLGPEKLPEVAKARGKAMRQFRTATDDIKRSVTDIDLNVPDYRPTRKEKPSPDTEKTPSEEREKEEIEKPSKEREGGKTGDG